LSEEKGRKTGNCRGTVAKSTFSLLEKSLSITPEKRGMQPGGTKKGGREAKNSVVEGFGVVRDNQQKKQKKTKNQPRTRAGQKSLGSLQKRVKTERRIKTNDRRGSSLVNRLRGTPDSKSITTGGNRGWMGNGFFNIPNPKTLTRKAVRIGKGGQGGRRQDFGLVGGMRFYKENTF